MMIHLPKLELLHNAMAAEDLTRRQFTWTNGAGRFRVIYLTDAGDTFGRWPQDDHLTLLSGTVPFAVLNFVDADDPHLHFAKFVTKGFKIVTQMGGDYDVLRRILGLTGYGKGELSVNDLFADFAEHIPGLPATRAPRPADVRPPRDVDEADKLYFLRIAPPGEGRRPTSANLQKTRAMLGDELADYCARNGCSSYWTDQPNDWTVDDIRHRYRNDHP